MAKQQQLDGKKDMSISRFIFSGQEYGVVIKKVTNSIFKKVTWGEAMCMSTRPLFFNWRNHT